MALSNLLKSVTPVSPVRVSSLSGPFRTKAITGGTLYQQTLMLNGPDFLPPTRPGRPLPGQDFHLLELCTFARRTWTSTTGIESNFIRIDST